MYFSKITAAAPGSICFQQRAEAAVYSITKEINASEASTKHGALSLGKRQLELLPGKGALLLKAVHTI